MSTIEFPLTVQVGEQTLPVLVNKEGFSEELPSWGKGLHQAQFAVLKSEELSSITTVKEKLSCKDRFLGWVGWYKWRVVQIDTNEGLKFAFIDVSVIDKKSETSFHKISPGRFHILRVDLPKLTEAPSEESRPTTEDEGNYPFIRMNTNAVHSWLIAQMKAAGRRICRAERGASPRGQGPEYTEQDFQELVLGNPVSKEMAAGLIGEDLTNPANQLD